MRFSIIFQETVNCLLLTCWDFFKAIGWALASGCSSTIACSSHTSRHAWYIFFISKPRIGASLGHLSTGFLDVLCASGTPIVRGSKSLKTGYMQKVSLVS